MIVLKPAMDRRALLRGLGVSMGLPLLEAMIPSKSMAADKGPLRLSIYYMPNGMILESFVPAQAGEGYAITPTLLPLERHRKNFTVITGLEHKNADSTGKADGGDHGRGCSSYLSGVHPKATQGFDIQAATTMDQYVAQEIGRQTQLMSLELGIESPIFVGTCDANFSCSYTNTISWSSPSTPLPITVNPREVFERLFGDQDKYNQATRMAQLRRQASLLDFVMDDATRLSPKLGAEDRQKIDEYMTSVRDLERRIQVAEAGNAKGALQLDVSRPAGVPDNFNDHMKMMIDLQILAMRADLTRVSSLMLGRELSLRSYTEIGISDAHHALSHHQGDPDKMAKVARINALFIQHFAYYLDQLQNTKEGDGVLLDRTFAMAGSALGDPNRHDHHHIPAIVAGGLVRGGRHIALEKGAPMANLLVSAMDAVGCTRGHIGDSTGPLKELTA